MWKKELHLLNNKIKYEDLCTLISNEIYHSSPKSVDKYLKATYKIILEQLQLNNSVYLKDFGTFEIKNRKSGSRIINNTNKKSIELYLYWNIGDQAAYNSLPVKRPKIVANINNNVETI